MLTTHPWAGEVLSKHSGINGRAFLSVPQHKNSTPGPEVCSVRDLRTLPKWAQGATPGIA